MGRPRAGSRLKGHGVDYHQTRGALGMRPRGARRGHPQSGREVPEYKVNATEFENLVRAAEEASCVIWARHGELRDTDLALSSHLAKMESKLAERKRVREEQIGSQVKRKGDAVRVKWPTRATMLKSAAGGDLYQRGLVEEAERTRWLKELAKQIKEADTCDVSGADHGLFAARIGKGRRANTLRKHVKTWGQFIGWLTATYGVKWPERPFQFADYLISRAMEPCGRSIPVSAFKTLVFMEHAAEIPKDLQLNTAGAIKNAMEEIKLRLEAADQKPRRQAKQLLVAMVSALGKESYGEGRTALHQSVCMVQTGQSMGCDEISRHYGSRL